MSMRLLILGLLMERELHPYEMRQTIKERNWNECFKLRDGSLYYAVDQLREDGLIEVSEIVSVPGDKRPDKTIYRITAAGKSAFLDLLYQQMDQSAFPQHPFFLTLPFIRHGEPDQVEALISAQLASCRQRVERMKAVLKLKEAYLPRGSALMIQGFMQFGEAEAAWLAQLLDEARSGSLFQHTKWTPEQIQAYLLAAREDPQQPE